MVIGYNEIIGIMEELAPSSLSLDWDNVGLLVGDKSKPVKKILVALDAIESVVDEAVGVGADLIITHHPFMFKPIKKVVCQTPIGSKIYKLIKNDIGIYSAHTNLDSVDGGINDVLANLCGLKNIRVIEESNREKFKKVVVYTPLDYVNSVKDAMYDAGGGAKGRYSNVSFSIEGIGEFKPLDGSKPFLGKENKIELVKEVRIEMLVREYLLGNVIEAMINSHPYEEVAYDVFNTQQMKSIDGIGRIGELEECIDFGEFAKTVKEKLGLKTMRVVGELDKKVKCIGLCSGSGIEYIEMAKELGAEVFITGDLRFHDSQKAISSDICVIDATHYASENIIVPVLSEYIRKKAYENKWEIEVLESKVDGQVFTDI